MTSKDNEENRVLFSKKEAMKGSLWVEVFLGLTIKQIASFLNSRPEKIWKAGEKLMLERNRFCLSRKIHRDTILTHLGFFPRQIYIYL